METIGSKRSYALIWCMPNNDDDDSALHCDMIVHGCLMAVVICRVRFTVFISLTLIVLFAFTYCISFSHPATVFQ